jgi:hypothetical protein
MQVIIGEVGASRPVRLQALIAAERSGETFLRYEDDRGAQCIAMFGPGDERIWLGRSAGCEIALGWDESTSRVHAELVRSGNTWLLVDEGVSTNGTFVNGQLLMARRRLAHLDVIRVGNVQLEFHAAGQQTMQTRADQAGPQAVVITPMQRNVLVALCRPLLGPDGSSMPATNRDIADELCLSLDAIKTHMRALFVRFELEDLPQNAKRTTLAERALSGGFITARDLKRNGNAS